MNAREPNITVEVDVTNPGQFFACCGLLELAHRLWPGAEGWFDLRRATFTISASGASASLQAVLSGFKCCELLADGETESSIDARETGDDSDEKASPLVLGEPFGLLLDWYAEEPNKPLKPWAGSMNGRLIFVAMKAAIDPDESNPLNSGSVVTDPFSNSAVTGVNTKRRRGRKLKKREPFYFDARRGAKATARDIGFMPDALNMSTISYPAVEALCLVGLQRFRPIPSDTPRVFDYRAWSVPLPPAVAAGAVCGAICGVGAVRYRFENAFRTDQRKHKGFMPATQIGEEP